MDINSAVWDKRILWCRGDSVLGWVGVEFGWGTDLGEAARGRDQGVNRPEGEQGDRGQG